MTRIRGSNQSYEQRHHHAWHRIASSFSQWHRRNLTVAIILAIGIIIAVLLVSLLPQPWSDVASNASNDSSRTLPTTSEHPEFTGPHKYEALTAWNNLHTELGRSILEDGVVTPVELAKVRKTYNECLSVYGLQAKTITDGNGEAIGESVVPIRGSMNSQQRSAVIDQCRAESDYQWLESLANAQSTEQSTKESQ
ncbi:hypothetical protein BLI708_08330 [Bifidobacterium imperatoris]|uniref:Uncharacterized protein n=1 Tax=Bifidobacterium imperatoris TaxID=2020965 RepID=A0A2N5IUT1_9BIFI|nr:hypothetical protein [Bifidobacterium imperatoris]PLS25686.1 hypothetical protein Tam1G_0510 [Bifidobacterium imperatoris]QSY57238.1 hypothetical protein BLI708_08330 [Bifidobacterium imperatoris]